MTEMLEFPWICQKPLRGLILQILPKPLTDLLVLNQPPFFNSIESRYNILDQLKIL